MSLAKRAEQLGGRWLGKSLIEIEKRDGPSTEPGGTPDKGEPAEDKEFAMDVICIRSVRYELNQVMEEGLRSRS